MAKPALDALVRHTGEREPRGVRVADGAEVDGLLRCVAVRRGRVTFATARCVRKIVAPSPDAASHFELRHQRGVKRADRLDAPDAELVLVLERVVVDLDRTEPLRERVRGEQMVEDLLSAAVEHSEAPLLREVVLEGGERARLERLIARVLDIGAEDSERRTDHVRVEISRDEDAGVRVGIEEPIDATTQLERLSGALHRRDVVTLRPSLGRAPRERRELLSFDRGRERRARR